MDQGGSTDPSSVEMVGFAESEFERSVDLRLEILPRTHRHQPVVFPRPWGQYIPSKKRGRSSVLGFGRFLKALHRTASSQLPPGSTMASNSQRQKGGDRALSILNPAIEALNLAKEISSATPAKAVFGTVSVVLAMIRVRFPQSTMITTLQFTFIQDSMANEKDYVDLGAFCADVCRALDRGLNGRRSNELNRSVLGAIEHLTM